MRKYAVSGPIRLFLLGAVIMFASGCSTTSTRATFQAEHDVGQRIAQFAKVQVGTPYKWGGKTPAGFDCSGLVLFVYNKFGVDVPRTAHAQYREAAPVRLDRLRPGDLLFFKIDSRRISHVAIYTGNGAFVHAPRSGTSVQVATLESEYWRRYLVGAGRYV